MGLEKEGQKLAFDSQADGEMRAQIRSMRLRPVLVSSKFMASVLAAGDMYV